MSELRVETLTMPGAELGPENPLPPLTGGRDIHVQREPVPGISEEMLRNIAYGHVPNILPYTMQDGYTRELQPRDFRVAVLENDILRATFILEMGGRLWSLLHKPSGRELLEVNPVFQPANLALRNAWFSGGVEWNIGTTGHTPFTCSPLFAARVIVQAEDGSRNHMPILRMYEWERIRQVPYQIDAYLPDGSPVLFVRIRILNPHDHVVPMYWWSNIAVPETPTTRVVVPADEAYSFGYGGGGLRRVGIPKIKGVDITYTTHVQRSADFFFHVPDGQRPWIAALDEQGRGLIQTSTARLKGRKLFLWGMGAGGRRWQTFLSKPGHAYIEIQAGLARTQLEHIPMPAKAEWAWLEAYGLMEADPNTVHSDNWQQARETVNAQLEALISEHTLNEEFSRSAAYVQQAPQTLIQRGSGWGTLERLRREAHREPPFVDPQAIIFDEAALTAQQAPWLTLLREGKLPDRAPQDAPEAYMTQTEWRDMLEEALQAGHTNWPTWLHVGVMRYQAEDREGAREAWEASLHAAPTAWATRNLALLAWQDGRFDHAATLYSTALRMQPNLLPLAVECGQKLIAMEHPQLWLDLLNILPAHIQQMGRIRLLEGQAALALNDFDRVAQIFEGSLVIDDLREGERSLSHLWIAYHVQRLHVEENVAIDETLHARVRREFPLPPELDFRMST